MNTPTFYRDPNTPNRFYFVPGLPTPELAPNRAPTLSLWVTDSNGRLQLGVQWQLSGPEMEQLRRIITARHPGCTPDEIDLQPAPMRIRAVELLVRNDDGALAPIATATSSGFLPFTTLFAVTLNPAQKNHAVAALHGRTGYLAVRYTADVLTDKRSSIERTADIGSWFTTRRGHDHIHVMPTARL
jgi:hypothetical protein